MESPLIQPIRDLMQQAEEMASTVAEGMIVSAIMHCPNIVDITMGMGTFSVTARYASCPEEDWDYMLNDSSTYSENDEFDDEEDAVLKALEPLGELMDEFEEELKITGKFFRVVRDEIGGCPKIVA